MKSESFCIHKIKLTNRTTHLKYGFLIRYTEATNNINVQNTAKIDFKYYTNRFFNGKKSINCISTDHKLPQIHGKLTKSDFSLYSMYLLNKRFFDVLLLKYFSWFDPRNGSLKFVRVPTKPTIYRVLQTTRAVRLLGKWNKTNSPTINPDFQTKEIWRIIFDYVAKMALRYASGGHFKNLSISK